MPIPMTTCYHLLCSRNSCKLSKLDLFRSFCFPTLFCCMFAIITFNSNLKQTKNSDIYYIIKFHSFFVNCFRHQFSITCSEIQIEKSTSKGTNDSSIMAFSQNFQYHSGSLIRLLLQIAFSLSLSLFSENWKRSGKYFLYEETIRNPLHVVFSLLSLIWFRM